MRSNVDGPPGRFRLRLAILSSLLISAGFHPVIAQGASDRSRPSQDWSRTASEALRGPGELTIGLCTFYVLAKTFLGLAGPIVGVLRSLYVAILVLCIASF